MCIRKYECSDSSEYVIYLDSESDYDIVYTINKNGISERRLNEWQK